MPRSSPFAIRLSSAEELELPTRADNDEIATRLDSRRDVVGRWRKRFFMDRLKGLEEQTRRGRPRGFFPQTS
jgi:hypothetical protein